MRKGLVSNRTVTWYNTMQLQKQDRRFLCLHTEQSTKYIVKRESHSVECVTKPDFVFAKKKITVNINKELIIFTSKERNTCIKEKESKLDSFAWIFQFQFDFSPHKHINLKITTLQDLQLQL